MMEESAASSKEPFTNVITGSKADNNLFCCVCCKPVYAVTKLNTHLRSYGHKICVERCKSVFEDHGEKVFCKTCEAEIKWKEIGHHGITHQIPPWCEFTKPCSKTFYHNHTVFFGRGYYFCYLCERFLDYWDTASSHFTDADHQDRREKFGTTADLSKNDHMYAIANGIVPGRDMRSDCKMCEKTGLKDEDIEEHSETAKHKENARKTAANIFALHETKKNSVVSEINVLETEKSTSELLKVELIKEDNNSENIEEEPKRIEQEESCDVAITNVFIETEKKETLFCCACCKPFKNVGKHQLTYDHKIYMKRCKTLFPDQGEKVYCKMCDFEIEWKEIEYHVKSHKIAPWCQSGKPNSKMLFHNHTIKFSKGYYFCFLCETFLDYWDTAISHFMEAHHQKLKRKFGQTELIETNHVLAVTQGIVPGKDMMNECKMCDITSLTIKDMKEHIKTATHKENRLKFGADIVSKHDETENCADSKSNFLDTEESTSKLLEADELPKEIKPKNIKVPYSRSMICNFSLQENPEESFTERKEGSTESGNFCKIKTEKSGAIITMEHEKRQNYADSDSDSSEFEESTCDVLKVELIKKDNNDENIEEPESRNMIFNFSLQESSNLATKSCSTESGNVVEVFHPLAEKHVEPSDDAFAKKIIVLREDKQQFCCLCGKHKKNLARHLRTYEHKLRLERCKSAFEDRGKNVFCKICSSEIELKEIVHHAEMHEIPPWSEFKKPSSESFSRNRTVRFTKGFCYCFLCERFLDYWDTAGSHFIEADHQERKGKCGLTADLEGTKYTYAENHGILPGPDMKFECKMCNKTGLNTQDIKRHVQTKDHFKSRQITTANILSKHQEKQNFSHSEPNGDMTFDFSAQESLQMTAKDIDSPKESGNANETLKPLSYVAFVNGILCTLQAKTWYCRTCCQSFLRLDEHLDSHKHKVYVQRFESVFEDRGEKFFCKICSSGIIWETLHDHGVLHGISPWAGHSPSAKIFFQNHTAKFSPGFCYCFLCDRFLDYWDTAAAHFKEADHQNRKLNFGPIVGLKKFPAAVADGIAPGKNRMFDCKICHITGLKADMQQHFKAESHKKNLEKFTTTIIKNHEERKNASDSASDFLDTAASTSMPLKPVPPKKDDNPKKIQVPYSRNMICNFTLEKIPDKEIPEEKEIPENNQTTDETEYPKLPVEGKPPESAKAALESINQNDDCPIKYIINSTSERCKTKDHCKSTETTAANILNKYQEKQNLSDSEPNGNMAFDVSVQESLQRTPKDVNSPKESGNANETLKPLRYTVFANGILCTLQAKKWYCRTCCECFPMLDEHLDSYKHKLLVQRFESAFEDRGEIFFCKMCSSGIDWETLNHHGRKHGIPPWAGHSPTAKKFFRNHTAKFSAGYCYCFLCDRFLDYWDTAVAHFKEADHQKRMLDFGLIGGVKKFPAAVADGIAPGKNMMFDCKMCHITASKTDMKQHSKADSHKKNLEKFTTTLIKNHEERKNSSNSASDFLDTVASTSKPLKPVPPKKDDNPKKIQVPYSRNMICNFTLEEIPDKEIPEEKESPENNQTTDETEYPKLPVEGKPPESAKAALESINQNDDCPIKYIVSSTSERCKTKDHRKSTETTAVNILSKHQEKQNLSHSEPNGNMTFDFSLQESLKMTPKDINSPKEAGNANETSPPSRYIVLANGIVGALQSKKWYCRPCRQSFSVLDEHLDSYKHKVYVQRFESVFEDHGENFSCKICSSGIDWETLNHHGRKHGIPPWAGHSPTAKKFFRNHTAKFSAGYCYCFLCDRFLDYWDTAVAHFKEADHQKRMLDFGLIGGVKKFPAAVADGIAPGKNMMFDCKMCHITASKTDMKQHSKADSHKKNLEKFTTTLIKNHEERKNPSDSASDFLDTAASTSKPLKPVPPQKDDNPKKIQVPYSRNMICNFTLEEIPDKEIPEEKESPENNQTTDETEYPKLPVEGKPPESAQTALESINQNDDWPIKYIVSSTSELCKMAIVGADMQRKRKIAKQDTEEPNPYCLICYSEIPGYAAVKDHLKGKRHETARQKYGCDNILLIEGEHYWCSACDGPVSGFNNVYRHITSNSHLSAIVRYQSNDHERQNNLEQVENLMETEENLPCLYIVKRNAKKSFCQICDETQHPVATKNINDHIASQRHKIALKRYGCDNIVPKGNDNYYCKCCLSNISNIENLYLHIKDKKHMSSLIKVSNNEGQRGKRRIETQMSTEDLNKPFQNLLSNYIAQQINKSLPTQAYETWQYSMASNFNVEPNHTDRSNFSNRFEPPGQTCGNSTASQNTGGFGFMSNFDFTEVKRKTEESQYRGQKLSALEHEARVKKIYCNVCGAKAEDTTELHVHMASHYAEEFVRFKSKKMKRADGSSHPAEQAPSGLLEQPEIELDDEIPNGLAMNGFSKPTVESSNGEIGENSSENDKTELVTKSGVTIQDKGSPQKMNRSGKRADMRKVAKQLDFDKDHIYDLDDKMEEVELGMMLGLVVDSSKMYCLICRKIVEYTLDNYYEHLENIDHCEYLEEMEADDALFQDFEDQFSDLALAKEYMEETSGDKVRCVICDEDVKNNARSLQAHIYHEIHERKCEETRAIARRCFERIKPRMYCDWYEVRKYWCVVCQSDTESEVNFMKHLNDQPHRKAMRRSENKNKRLFFDFCASCAVLWYGYRCTHSYHNDIDSHKWLQRDGHYVLTELPKLAKSLLAAPEDFVDDKIKFLDAVFESELEREKLLIRDLERAAKMKFPRSKAHLFGSRISGLGSPDSDIDVFLDCRDFYDGQDLTNDELLFFIDGVHQCLCKDPQLWDVDELLTDCRIPIIKATHRATELSCDISFENGLSVENTKLIKAFNHVFPTCRKITLFLKQWLLHCGLSGSRGITSYALYWFVIFYLQQETILPSVQRLIAMRRRSHTIAGWEVGVTHNFTYNEEVSTLTFRNLLIRFFIFYANFDFRYNVACPLLGEVVEKREFVNPRSLPREMERYIAYMRGRGNPEPFRIDSPMCIQDPFDLQHNLTKAVNKVYLNRFRKCCAKSLEILCPP